jgi:hypothetical protein
MTARVYHGTALPDHQLFDQFDPRVNSSHLKPSDKVDAVWLTSEPRLGGRYAQSAAQDFTESYAFKRAAADPEFQRLEQAQRDAYENIYKGKVPPFGGNKLRKMEDEKLAIIDRYRKEAKGAGAVVIPADVSFQRPRVVDGARVFSPQVYAKELEAAAKAGNDGVVFRQVVDTPSGVGEPADVFAAIKPNTVYSAIDGSRLYGGAAAAGAVGAGALALQPEDAEAAPRMTPEEAYASQIAADRQEFFSQPGPMLARAAAETFDPTGFGIAASNNLRDQGLTVAQIIPRLPMEYGRLAGDTAKSFLGYIDPEYRARAGTSDFAADFRPLGEAVRTAGDWIDSKLTGRPMQTYRKAPPMAAPVMR